MTESVTGIKESGIEYGKRIEVIPGINDIRDMTTTSRDMQWELGVLSYKTTRDKKYAIYKKGTDPVQILEPTPIVDVEDRATDGVFIHTHFTTGDEPKKGINTLMIFPSSNGLYGDFSANYTRRKLAGYLNIASPPGLTLNIGIERMDRQEYITRSLLRRQKQFEKAAEEVWKFRYGKLSGQSFSDEEIQKMAKKEGFSLPVDEVMLFSNTRTGSEIRNFLYLPWDFLIELDNVHKGFENLCFGNGVDNLIDMLDVNIIHDSNLSKTARKISLLPAGRNQKTS